MCLIKMLWACVCISFHNVSLWLFVCLYMCVMTFQKLAWQEDQKSYFLALTTYIYIRVHATSNLARYAIYIQSHIHSYYMHV